MYPLMAATTYQDKVSEIVVVSASVDMVNVVPHSVSSTYGTYFFTRFKKTLAVILSTFGVVRKFLSIVLSFLSRAIFASKSLILTLFATVGTVFSSARGKVSSLAAVLTDYRHKFASVPVVEASATAKPLLLASLGVKFNAALLTFFDEVGTLVSIFLTASHRTKTLAFAISTKYKLAVRTYFFHALSITHLFINGPVKHKGGRYA